MTSSSTSIGRTVEFPGRQLIFVPVSMLIFAFVLHWVYAELVSPAFSYLGYRYRSPNTDVVVISLFVATGAALALPRRVDRGSSVVLWVLFVITVAPTILMAPYMPYRDDSQAVMLGLVVAAVFAGICLGLRGSVRPLTVPISSSSIGLVVATVSAVTYSLLAVTHGIDLRFLSFLDVYDVRGEYATNLEGVRILSYLVFSQANVVNPLLVARGLFLRRRMWIASGVIGQLVLYSSTGFKSMILVIPAWFILACLLRRGKRAIDGLVLMWGTSILIVTSAILDHVTGNILLTSLLVRRFVVTPGVLTSVYVEFFSEHPQVHLGHSVFRSFVDYPYNAAPPYVIGEWMAGLPTMAANANMFADGFANFGWAGLVAAGVVLLVYLKVLDRVSDGLPVGVVGVIMTMPAVALANASVLTAMLSHGLVAALILVAIMPRDYGFRRFDQSSEAVSCPRQTSVEHRARKANKRLRTRRS